ncbi:MATE family efflux transporter [Haloplasma contractile]|uniref:Uncharacterized protein n=1 Tax=Haloplasma contractile SSD-17B TaxID=1033810 RepID=U2FQB4_9MOLU|nr:ABC transporter permease [Haloplasma contractile]ERJ13229.1 hypothetical protein HLPCO_000853 [Haloplasma contractile SSD-17B]
MKLKSNNYKKIKRDLKQYKKSKGSKFWSLPRIYKVALKSLFETRLLWILLFSMILTIILLAYMNLFKNVIYFSLIITFILSSYILINFIFIIDKNISKEYKQFFGRTHPNFRMVLSKFTFASGIITVIIIGLFHIFYIEHYINAPLETCTYYDMYGNKLVDTSIPFQNRCNITKEEYKVDEDGNLEYLSFRTHHINTDHDINYKYEYTYKSRKIIKRVVHEYQANSHDLEHTKVHRLGIYYSHTSRETQFIYGENNVIVQEKEYIHNILNDEQIILATKHELRLAKQKNEVIQINVGNQFHPTLLVDDNYLRSQVFTDEYFNLLKSKDQHLYCYDGCSDASEYIKNLHRNIKDREQRMEDAVTEIGGEWVLNNETDQSLGYHAMGYYHLIFDDNNTIKYYGSSIEDYSIKINYKEQIDLDVIESYRNKENNRKFTFNTQFNVNGNIIRIDQKENMTLQYRHLFEKKEYGYKVKHFSYEKKGLRFITNKYKQEQCYIDTQGDIFEYFPYYTSHFIADKSEKQCGPDLIQGNNLLIDHLVKK